MPLAEAQAEFAAKGQMLALDPALGDGATIGGVMATNDSGPLRHRYGSMRDLVVGTTVALSDGTLAHSGGKVIKNVAGYDLAQAVHRLVRHARADRARRRAAAPARRPRRRPRRRAATTRTGSARPPSRSPRTPLEADCLDVDWRDGAGRLLVRFGGPSRRRPGARDARRGCARRARGLRR